MPDLRPGVDFEALVVEYLRSSTLVATYAPDAVGTRLPRAWAPAPDGAPGWVRPSRIGGAPDPRDPVGHVARPRFQIDTFAATETDAFDLCAVVVAELLRLPSSGWTYPGAVVNAVQLARDVTAREDPTTEIPGYYAEVILIGHAVGV